MSMWLRHKLRVKKSARRGFAISCEPLEGRALMATFQVIATPHAVAPAFGTPLQVAPQLVSQVQAKAPALYAAFETFLDDLATAIHSPSGLQGASATLSNDVQLILAASPSTTSQVATRLSNDVTTVTTSGSLSATNSQQLTSDLTTVLAGALAPAASTSGTGSGSGSSSVAAPSKTSSSQATTTSTFNDPNAPSTALSDVSRAQGVGDSSTSVDVTPDTSASASQAKKAALGKLLGDLSTIFAKAPAIAPLAKNDLRADFVAISAVAHQPTSQSVATLQNHVTQMLAAGKLDANGRATLSNDLSAVLSSAGVSSRLADRTQLDLNQVLASPDVLPGDVGTLLDDLSGMLLNLPAAATVPNGPASWFFGKTPLGK